MPTKTGARLTAQDALSALGSSNGWEVRAGAFSERRLSFERGGVKATMLTADFHPGGALKNAIRYEGGKVVAELRKDDPKRRKTFEGWLREKPALTDPNRFKVEPIDPDTGASAAEPEVESPEVKFCGLPSAQMGCVLCGAVVFDMRAHTEWHKGMGR
ncbi:hypothetical protein SEA_REDWATTLEHOG_141 [Gordonia phage RedWattleHog]|uniref:Uncharacterized protein n=1 Tax=Gordonia phage Stormageddon TaxID=2656541 RepID=A0A649VSS5_9CAUD|nr:hypothetical protein KHQ86_gp161 [Gordonia phage Stormageddon]QGJ94999.1 hypothetical protein SEA_STORMAGEDDON_139 [Gordonia phage Stormageddon]QLF83644.1 hypothetical protein SEA_REDWATTLEHOG_141 [Gordonia phage RedWattleHog]